MGNARRSGARCPLDFNSPLSMSSETTCRARSGLSAWAGRGEFGYQYFNPTSLIQRREFYLHPPAMRVVWGRPARIVDPNPPSRAGAQKRTTMSATESRRVVHDDAARELKPPTGKRRDGTVDSRKAEAGINKIYRARDSLRGRVCCKIDTIGIHRGHCTCRERPQYRTDLKD